MFHIVEDEIEVSEVLSEMMEMLGYDALAFHCPQKYISYVNSHDYVKPIATFTDIRMPVMSGFEMIEKISSTHPDKKFVVMSGNAERYREFKELVCMYLCKPFHAECLEKIIAALKNCHLSATPSDEACSTAGCHQQRHMDQWFCPHIGKETSPA